MSYITDGLRRWVYATLKRDRRDPVRRCALEQLEPRILLSAASDDGEPVVLGAEEIPGPAVLVAESNGEADEEVVGLQSASAATPRHIWLWAEILDVMDHVTATADEFSLSGTLDYLQDQGITTIYAFAGQFGFMGAYPLLEDPTFYELLISNAHARGMEVYALLDTIEMDTAFTDTFQNVLDYNKVRADDLQFDGVNLDIEPWQLPSWDTDREGRALVYLDILESFATARDTDDPDLLIGPDMPFWFDTFEVTRPSDVDPRPMYHYVQDLADYVTILDFRDFAIGSDGIVAHAEDELDYAETISKPVVIGVEVSDLGNPSLEKITFFEEGEEVLEAELALADAEFTANYTQFLGFAIQDFGAYVLLDPSDPPEIDAALANDTGADNSDGVTSDPTITGAVTDMNDIVLLEVSLDGSLLRDPVFINLPAVGPDVHDSFYGLDEGDIGDVLVLTPDFLTPSQMSVNWTFTGLRQGFYQVSTSWATGGARASNAPFTLRDGESDMSGTLIRVNQQNEPLGFLAPDETEITTPWEHLADSSSPFEVTGDSLIVEMGNDADGFTIGGPVRIQDLTNLAPAETDWVDETTKLLGDGSFTLDEAVLDQLAGGDLSLGKHTVFVRATDVYGFTSSVFELSFTLTEAEAPALMTGLLQQNSQTEPVAVTESINRRSNTSGPILTAIVSVSATEPVIMSTGGLPGLTRPIYCFVNRPSHSRLSQRMTSQPNLQVELPKAAGIRGLRLTGKYLPWRAELQAATLSQTATPSEESEVTGNESNLSGQDLLIDALGEPTDHP